MADNTFSIDGKNFRVIGISNEIRKEAQKYYSKALMDGFESEVPLRADIDKHLKDRGLIDPAAQEERIEALQKEVRDLEVRLRKATIDDRRMTKQEGKEIALEMLKKRDELGDVGGEYSALYNNTIEGNANAAQLLYFIYACTLDADTSNRYWKSYEDFQEDSESEIYTQATKTFLSTVMGADADYEHKFYENKWLKRMGYMNDKLQLIDDQGRVVDAKGRLIDEDGNFINEEGHKVDAFGNLVNEDGELIEDGWELNAE